LPFCDFIFGNELEAKSFANKNDISTDSMEDIAIGIAQLPKKNSKKKRFVIITQVR